MSSTPNAFLAKDSWQTPRNARTLRAYMALHNQEIAERLKELRASKGNPPQKLVAARIGIEPRTLQTWEAGDAKPSYRNLEPLARFYGVSEEFILTGTEHAVQESPVVVSEQLDAVVREFRGHVAEVKNMLAEARSERDAIRELLAAQQHILDEMRRVASGLPDDESLRAVTSAARRAVELGQAAAEARGETPSTEPGTGRRLASGE
jgi:transcriptional regulator with XRE-family HTH domain